MMRRVLIGLFMVLLIEYPIIQIFLMIASSLQTIIYLEWYLPFESKLLNAMEIMNEICLMLANYHMLAFSEWVDDP